MKRRFFVRVRTLQWDPTVSVNGEIPSLIEESQGVSMESVAKVVDYLSYCASIFAHVNVMLVLVCEFLERWYVEGSSFNHKDQYLIIESKPLS